MPYATPPQLAYGAPTPMPAPRRPARWPWVVLAVLLAGGATAAAVVLATRDAPAPAAAPAASVPGTPTDFRSSKLGYAVQVPAGLSANENAATGGMQANGHHDGHAISIAVEPVGGAADVASRAAQIEQATAGAATVVERRTRRIRGEDLVSIVYDVAKSGSRFETVFYAGEPALAVTFAARSDHFDDTAALRDALFRDRFRPDGSAVDE
jgi:hypothetical protein